MQPLEEIATKRQTPHVVARPKPCWSAPRRAAARNRLHEILPRLLGCYQRWLRPANIGDGNSSTSNRPSYGSEKQTPPNFAMFAGGLSAPVAPGQYWQRQQLYTRSGTMTNRRNSPEGRQGG